MSEEQFFLRPRLTGKRFTSPGIPLEFLKDLAALEDLVIEVAKYAFLEANKDRKRSPSGFAKSVELKLTKISGGSVTPEIQLASTSDMAPHQRYFETARGWILETIRAAENGEFAVKNFPEDKLFWFEKIGRSLKDSEAIEFTAPDGSRPARLTKKIRRRLLLTPTKATGITEDVAVRGTIHEVDQDNMTFTTTLIDGGKVSGRIEPQHRDQILEAFHGYQQEKRVLLKGVGYFDRARKLLRFESIEHINMLDDLDVAARLDELRSLKDGWHEDGGRAPSSEGLDWLTQAFEEHYPDEAPLPYLYPTPEGGIQAEWNIERSAASVEFNLEDHSGYWHVLDLDTKRSADDTMNFDDKKAWQQLAEKLRSLPANEA